MFKNDSLSIFIRLCLSVVGTSIIALGIVFFRLSSLGIDPATAADIGISNTFTNTFNWYLGNYQLIFNVILFLTICIFDRSQFGIGTLINMSLLVVTTLQRSLSTDKKPNYLHTDMGSQFTSFGFENLLKRHKIDHSYSKLGHPYDNAKIESFHSLLKREMIYQFRFPSIAHLILDVSKYIHWFNNERISLANQKIKVA
ncbi:integrase core domain-containing protein [Leuconostoc mesenteroides]|uniref:integrase core domain-containing protein n=1 Tax=Leuconostoc mesenteroides TaxID=1245 RepID=UPI00235F34AB|nr:integrase core domain-containing protein [Leuconostoc mesenteroides]